MMSDKTLQERLREPDWWMDDTLNEEAADALDDKHKRIAELEARSKRWDSINRSIAQHRDELAAVVREVADSHFDLSLHKQHDTLSYLKHNAQKALAKLDGDA